MLDPEDTAALGRSMLSKDHRTRFAGEPDFDFGFAIPGLSRFRANLFRQRGSVACAIRRVPVEIPSLRELGVPSVVGRLADKPRGLVLVTGPTGSGKSTTLAAMVDRINTARAGHIVTIEDPIEFVHPHKRCIVNQREIGQDTPDFASALRYTLRQDPDVILIGELRDPETIQAALTVAETGHLALGTLHTRSAAGVHPPDHRCLPGPPAGAGARAVRPRLRGRHHPDAASPGAGAAAASWPARFWSRRPAVRALIREAKVHQIHSAMQAARRFGMRTLNDALHRLYVRRQVDFDECLRITSDAAEFRRMANTSASDGSAP